MTPRVVTRRLHPAIIGVRRQRGFAMIAILTLVVLVSAYLIVSALNRTTAEISNSRGQRNMNALVQAKAALIAYAASTEGWQAYKGQTTSQPGGLPCPDTNDDGTSQGICSGAANRVGRLPWATIGSDDLRDASGERLWYAVSSNFYKSSANIINSDTRGLLTVTGTAPASNVVAIVFAPGPPLSGQDRIAMHNNPSAYLEQFVIGASDYTFTANAVSSSTYNDRLVVITQADLMATVEPVVAARIQRDIKPLIFSTSGGNSYFEQWGAFPFPVQFNDPTIADPAVNPVSPNNVGPGNSGDRAQSAYVGNTAQLSGGLLPVTASAPYIWSALTPPVQITSGNGNLSWTGTPCAATSGPPSGWQCNFTVSPVDIAGFQFIFNPTFQIQAQVSNVGLSLAVLPSASNVQASPALSSTSVTGALIVPVSSTAPGTVTFVGTYIYFCSNFLPPACPGSINFQVVIPDVVASAATNASNTTTGWFIANQWYRQTYYAVSPGYLPGGGANCSLIPPAPPCLTVNNIPSPNNDKRAILVLAGRALDGSARPSANLSSYLEGENLTPADFVYEHRQGSPTSINDRVVVLSP